MLQHYFFANDAMLIIFLPLQLDMTYVFFNYAFSKMDSIVVHVLMVLICLPARDISKSSPTLWSTQTWHDLSYKLHSMSICENILFAWKSHCYFLCSGKQLFLFHFYSSSVVIVLKSYSNCNVRFFCTFTSVHMVNKIVRHLWFWNQASWYEPKCRRVNIKNCVSFTLNWFLQHKSYGFVSIRINFTHLRFNFVHHHFVTLRAEYIFWKIFDI